jgi:hypothetical protein
MDKDDWSGKMVSCGAEGNIRVLLDHPILMLTCVPAYIGHIYAIFDWKMICQIKRPRPRPTRLTRTRKEAEDGDNDRNCKYSPAISTYASLYISVISGPQYSAVCHEIVKNTELISAYLNHPDLPRSLGFSREPSSRKKKMPAHRKRVVQHIT